MTSFRVIRDTYKKLWGNYNFLRQLSYVYSTIESNMFYSKSFVYRQTQIVLNLRYLRDLLSQIKFPEGYINYEL